MTAPNERRSLFLEQHAPILAAAERSIGLDAALTFLRELGLDDFGLLLWSLPDSQYPNLSRLLPRMAAVDIQNTWTGDSGMRLLGQSLSFMRLLESISTRESGRSLQGRRILDFGCGYGRLMRLLYYHTDPANVVGVDAWEQSLEICRKDGLLGTFVKSDDVPRDLGVGGVDLAFSYSVFTHLSEEAFLATLAAVRETLAPAGLFVFTIRPVEFWRYIESVKGLGIAEEMEARHQRSGFAFHPLNSPTFGEASIATTYLEQLSGWQLLGSERLLDNPHQLVVVFRAR